jgi:hemerythrin-like domain-containing protein
MAFDQPTDEVTALTRAPTQQQPGEAADVASRVGGDALDQLAGFHDDIRTALEDLQRLARGCSRPKQLAAELVTFFEGPFRWHDLDEGTSLFPRLQRLKATVDLEDLLRQLTRSQDVVDQRLAILVPHLRSIAAGGRPDPILLRTNTRDLLGHLDRHLTIEEEVVFPLARQCLSATAIDAIGGEIGAREGDRKGGRRVVFLSAQRR